MAEVVVKVKLAKEQLDKDLKIAEQELTRHEQEYDKINRSLRSYKDTLEDTKQKIQENQKEIEKWNDLQNRINSGRASLQDFTEYTGNPKMESNLLKEKENLSKAQSQLNDKIDSYNSKLEKASITIEKSRDKVDRINMKRVANDAKEAEANMKNITGKIGDVANGTESIIRKVGRWALAIFSIRSAYNLVRQASSTLASYNEKYAANLEYIRYALAQMLAPILEYIVSLVMTLLQYLNAILNAWFGINLFGNASAKSFQKMKSASASTAKSAKEIKNALAGFDEMNVLSDTSSSGAGGGAGGGAIAPSMDLSGIPKELPSWIQWIVDNKDGILEFFTLLGAIIAGIKIAELLNAFGLLGENLSSLDVIIKGLGIGVAIFGIITAVKGLLDYLKDPSWKNFGKIITGVGLAIAGVAIAVGAWPVAVAGAVVAIVGLIVQNWEKIKSFLQNGIDWLTGKSDWIHEMFGDVIGGLYDFAIENLQNFLNFFDDIFKGVKLILDGIIEFVKGVFIGDWEKAWNGLKKILIGAFQTIIAPVKLVFSTIFSDISSRISLIVNLFRGFGTKIGGVVGSAFKTAVNGALSVVENILNAPIRAINGLLNVINAVPGVNINKINTFKLPRLATGAIINNPGRGVMVGGGTAIAGEAGKEGILPLTDTQAMAQLGEEIGKHVTINANITNTMNGRVIAKILQQIQNEKEFAYNR